MSLRFKVFVFSEPCPIIRKSAGVDGDGFLILTLMMSGVVSANRIANTRRECHPERVRTIREAGSECESKDPDNFKRHHAVARHSHKNSFVPSATLESDNPKDLKLRPLIMRFSKSVFQLSIAEWFPERQRLPLMTEPTAKQPNANDSLHAARSSRVMLSGASFSGIFPALLSFASWQFNSAPSSMKNPVQYSQIINATAAPSVP